jgi:hypothetical protein
MESLILRKKEGKCAEAVCWFGDVERPIRGKQKGKEIRKESAQKLRLHTLATQFDDVERPIGGK